MANNGKGIGPRGLGAPKSMAKYGSMAKQAEPKTGEKKETEVKNKPVEAVKKVAKAVSDDLIKGGAESKRQTRLARGAQKGTFFGLEKLFD
jgi:hypothetical protein